MAILALLAIHLVAPQSGGPLALTQIVEPLLVLVAILVVPFAVRSRPGVVAALLLAAFVIGRYGPGVVSFPAGPPAGDELRAVSWNVRGNATAPADLVESLAATDADIVALQELSREQAAAIEADPRLAARLPHRVLKPEGRLEMGLLSAFPILSKETTGDPKTIEVTVDRGRLGRLAVITVHPLPRGIVTAGPIPVGFDAATRDEELAGLRDRIDRLTGGGTPVLVVGDLNLTDREPAYARLTDGLFDAQLEVGSGWGATWRPGWLRDLPVAFLRIDYVLSSADLVPVSLVTDCTPRGSDHCRLSAVLRSAVD